MKKGISKFQGLALLAMMTMSSAMTVSLTSCSNEDNISDIPSKLKIEDIDAELIRATDAQIKKYQEEADKWHGGANCPGMGIGCNDKASSDLFQIGSRCDIVRITAAAKKVVCIKGEGATYSIGFSNCYTKAAINDIVFGRTPWFSAKFQSEEYENALKESPFVYPKN